MTSTGAICYLIITLSGNNRSIRLKSSMKGIQRFRACQVENTWKLLALYTVTHSSTTPGLEQTHCSLNWHLLTSAPQHQILAFSASNLKGHPLLGFYRPDFLGELFSLKCIRIMAKRLLRKRMLPKADQVLQIHFSLN